MSTSSFAGLLRSVLAATLLSFMAELSVPQMRPLTYSHEEMLSGPASRSATGKPREVPNG